MTLVPVTRDALAKIQPGGKLLYYTCPMPEHSDVHADKPGKCPKCGMTLIPVMEQPKPAQATNPPATATAIARETLHLPHGRRRGRGLGQAGQVPEVRDGPRADRHGDARQDRGGELAQAASGAMPQRRGMPEHHH